MDNTAGMSRMACAAFLGDRRAYTGISCHLHTKRNDAALVVEVDREGREVLLGLHVDRHFLVAISLGRT